MAGIWMEFGLKFDARAEIPIEGGKAEKLLR